MPDTLTQGDERSRLAERCARGELKALSIKQPYPHHIFYDGEDVENRDWPTRGRGWFLIHAGKKDDEDRDLIRAKRMPLGGIVGLARITDCVDAMDSPWFFGRYGFVLADAFPIELVPCRGQLGFFAPPTDVLTATAAAIRAALSKALPSSPDHSSEEGQ